MRGTQASIAVRAGDRPVERQHPGIRLPDVFAAGHAVRQCRRKTDAIEEFQRGGGPEQTRTFGGRFVRKTLTDGQHVEQELVESGIHDARALETLEASEERSYE